MHSSSPSAARSKSIGDARAAVLGESGHWSLRQVIDKDVETLTRDCGEEYYVSKNVELHDDCVEKG